MTRGPDKQFDRDEVLDRAMHLFWEQGYEATSLAQLLERMQIGRQSMYDTFGDKRSLFLQALDRYRQEHLAPMAACLQRPGAPLDNVEAFLRASAKMIADGGHCGCMLGNTVAELSKLDPELSTELGRSVGDVEALLMKTLARARETGDLHSPLTDRELARLLVAAAQGVALISKLDAHEAWGKTSIRSLMTLLRGA